MESLCLQEQHLSNRRSAVARSELYQRCVEPSLEAMLNTIDNPYNYIQTEQHNLRSNFISAYRSISKQPLTQNTNLAILIMLAAWPSVNAWVLAMKLFYVMPQ